MYKTNFRNRGESIDSLVTPGAMAAFTESNYLCQTSNTTSANNTNPTVSDVDKEFLERISSTLRDIRLTRIPNDAERPKSRFGSSAQIQKAMAEKKSEFTKKEDDMNQALLDKERDLWENERWRDRVKDLNSSFSKITPICQGKKIVAGKGQAFIVDLDNLDQ